LLWRTCPRSRNKCFSYCRLSFSYDLCDGLRTFMYHNSQFCMTKIKLIKTFTVFDVWAGKGFAWRWHRCSGLRDRSTEGQVILLLQLLHALAFVLSHLFIPVDVDILPFPCGSCDQCHIVCVPDTFCEERCRYSVEALG
jgi:hypothetical protein